MGRFINGECLEQMKKIPDGCIDFIFTSPPYADQIKDYGSTGVKIAPSKFADWFLPRAKEMFRILKNDGSFVLDINDKVDGSYQSTFVFKLVIMMTEEVGFHLVRDYIWYNPATPPNVFSRGNLGRTKKSHEYCFWFSKSNKWTFHMDAIRKPYSASMQSLLKSLPHGDRTVNTRPSRHNFDLSHPWKDKGGADPGSVIEISNTSSNDMFHRLCKQFGVSHPARFPIKLAEFFIKAGTNEGDVVLDPFAGSGTTAIAAKKLGRDFLYIEINPDYWKMAKKWYNVKFHGNTIYKINMRKFEHDVIPVCRWNLLPYSYLYDLFYAWLPKVGLYEIPQTRKAFRERINAWFVNNPDWIITNHYQTVTKENMPLPEPLIVKYDLKNWKNGCDSKNKEEICSPKLGLRYMGIMRRGTQTETEGIE